jgi:hypothetical protein
VLFTFLFDYDSLLRLDQNDFVAVTLSVQDVGLYSGLELSQLVKLLRNIAFIFVLAQDTVGAELHNLLGRKVKAIV